MIYDNLKMVVVTEEELNLFTEMQLRSMAIPFLQITDKKFVNEYIGRLNAIGYNYHPSSNPSLILILDHRNDNYKC